MNIQKIAAIFLVCLFYFSLGLPQVRQIESINNFGFDMTPVSRYASVLDGVISINRYVLPTAVTVKATLIDGSVVQKLVSSGSWDGSSPDTVISVAQSSSSSSSTGTGVASYGQIEVVQSAAWGIEGQFNDATSVVSTWLNQGIITLPASLGLALNTSIGDPAFSVDKTLRVIVQLQNGQVVQKTFSDGTQGASWDGSGGIVVTATPTTQATVVARSTIQSVIKAMYGNATLPTLFGGFLPQEAPKLVNTDVTTTVATWLQNGVINLPVKNGNLSVYDAPDGAGGTLGREYSGKPKNLFLMVQMTDGSQAHIQFTEFAQAPSTWDGFSPSGTYYAAPPSARGKIESIILGATFGNGGKSDIPLDKSSLVLLNGNLMLPLNAQNKLSVVGSHNILNGVIANPYPNSSKPNYLSVAGTLTTGQKFFASWQDGASTKLCTGDNVIVSDASASQQGVVANIVSATWGNRGIKDIDLTFGSVLMNNNCAMLPYSSTTGLFSCNGLFLPDIGLVANPNQGVPAALQLMVQLTTGDYAFVTIPDGSSMKFWDGRTPVPQAVFAQRPTNQGSIKNVIKATLGSGGANDSDVTSFVQQWLTNGNLVFPIRVISGSQKLAVVGAPNGIPNMSMPGMPQSMLQSMLSSGMYKGSTGVIPNPYPSSTSNNLYLTVQLTSNSYVTLTLPEGSSTVTWNGTSPVGTAFPQFSTKKLPAGSIKSIVKATLGNGNANDVVITSLVQSWVKGGNLLLPLSPANGSVVKIVGVPNGSGGFVQSPSSGATNNTLYLTVQLNNGLYVTMTIAEGSSTVTWDGTGGTSFPLLATVPTQKGSIQKIVKAFWGNGGTSDIDITTQATSWVKNGNLCCPIMSATNKKLAITGIPNGTNSFVANPYPSAAGGNKLYVQALLADNSYATESFQDGSATVTWNGSGGTVFPSFTATPSQVGSVQKIVKATWGNGGASDVDVTALAQSWVKNNAVVFPLSWQTKSTLAVAGIPNGANSFLANPYLNSRTPNNLYLTVQLTNSSYLATISFAEGSQISSWNGQNYPAKLLKGSATGTGNIQTIIKATWGPGGSTDVDITSAAVLWLRNGNVELPLTQGGVFTATGVPNGSSGLVTLSSVGSTKCVLKLTAQLTSGAIVTFTVVDGATTTTWNAISPAGTTLFAAPPSTSGQIQSVVKALYGANLTSAVDVTTTISSWLLNGTLRFLQNTTGTFSLTQVPPTIPKKLYVTVQLKGGFKVTCTFVENSKISLWDGVVPAGIYVVPSETQGSIQKVIKILYGYSLDNATDITSIGSSWLSNGNLCFPQDSQGNLCAYNASNAAGGTIDSYYSGTPRNLYITVQLSNNIQTQITFPESSARHYWDGMSPAGSNRAIGTTKGAITAITSARFGNGGDRDSNLKSTVATWLGQDGNVTFPLNAQGRVAVVGALNESGASIQSPYPTATSPNMLYVTATLSSGASAFTTIQDGSSTQLWSGSTGFITPKVTTSGTISSILKATWGNGGSNDSDVTQIINRAYFTSNTLTLPYNAATNKFTLSGAWDGLGNVITNPYPSMTSNTLYVTAQLNSGSVVYAKFAEGSSVQPWTGVCPPGFSSLTPSLSAVGSVKVILQATFGNGGTNDIDITSLAQSWLRVGNGGLALPVNKNGNGTLAIAGAPNGSGGFIANPYPGATDNKLYVVAQLKSGAYVYATFAEGSAAQTWNGTAPAGIPVFTAVSSSSGTIQSIVSAVWGNGGARDVDITNIASTWLSKGNMQFPVNKNGSGALAVSGAPNNSGGLIANPYPGATNNTLRVTVTTTSGNLVTRNFTEGSAVTTWNGSGGTMLGVVPSAQGSVQSVLSAHWGTTGRNVDVLLAASTLWFNAATKGNMILPINNGNLAVTNSSDGQGGSIPNSYPNQMNNNLFLIIRRTDGAIVMKTFVERQPAGTNGVWNGEGGVITFTVPPTTRGIVNKVLSALWGPSQTNTINITKAATTYWCTDATKNNIIFPINSKNAIEATGTPDGEGGVIETPLTTPTIANSSPVLNNLYIYFLALDGSIKFQAFREGHVQTSWDGASATTIFVAPPKASGSITKITSAVWGLSQSNGANITMAAQTWLNNGNLMLPQNPNGSGTFEATRAYNTAGLSIPNPAGQLVKPTAATNSGASTPTTAATQNILFVTAQLSDGSIVTRSFTEGDSVATWDGSGGVKVAQQATTAGSIVSIVSAMFGNGGDRDIDLTAVVSAWLSNGNITFPLNSSGVVALAGASTARGGTISNPYPTLSTPNSLYLTVLLSDGSRSQIVIKDGTTKASWNGQQGTTVFAAAPQTAGKLKTITKVMYGNGGRSDVDVTATVAQWLINGNLMLPLTNLINGNVRVSGACCAQGGTIANPYPLSSAQNSLYITAKCTDSTAVSTTIQDGIGTLKWWNGESGATGDISTATSLGSHGTIASVVSAKFGNGGARDSDLTATVQSWLNSTGTLVFPKNSSGNLGISGSVDNRGELIKSPYPGVTNNSLYLTVAYNDGSQGTKVFTEGTAVTQWNGTNPTTQFTAPSPVPGIITSIANATWGNGGSADINVTQAANSWLNNGNLMIPFGPDGGVKLTGALNGSSGVIANPYPSQTTKNTFSVTANISQTAMQALQAKTPTKSTTATSLFVEGSGKHLWDGYVDGQADSFDFSLFGTYDKLFSITRSSANTYSVGIGGKTSNVAQSYNTQTNTLVPAPAMYLSASWDKYDLLQNLNLPSPFDKLNFLCNQIIFANTPYTKDVNFASNGLFYQQGINFIGTTSLAPFSAIFLPLAPVTLLMSLIGIEDAWNYQISLGTAGGKNFQAMFINQKNYDIIPGSLTVDQLELWFTLSNKPDLWLGGKLNFPNSSIPSFELEVRLEPTRITLVGYQAEPWTNVFGLSWLTLSNLGVSVGFPAPLVVGVSGEMKIGSFDAKAAVAFNVAPLSPAVVAASVDGTISLPEIIDFAVTTGLPSSLKDIVHDITAMLPNFSVKNPAFSYAQQPQKIGAFYIQAGITLSGEIPLSLLLGPIGTVLKNIDSSFDQYVDIYFSWSNDGESQALKASVEMPYISVDAGDFNIFKLSGGPNNTSTGPTFMFSAGTGSMSKPSAFAKANGYISIFGGAESAACDIDISLTGGRITADFESFFIFPNMHFAMEAALGSLHFAYTGTVAAPNANFLLSALPSGGATSTLVDGLNAVLSFGNPISSVTLEGSSDRLARGEMPAVIFDVSLFGKRVGTIDIDLTVTDPVGFSTSIIAQLVGILLAVLMDPLEWAFDLADLALTGAGDALISAGHAISSEAARIGNFVGGPVGTLISGGGEVIGEVVGEVGKGLVITGKALGEVGHAIGDALHAAEDAVKDAFNFVDEQITEGINDAANAVAEGAVEFGEGVASLATDAWDAITDWF